MNYDDYMKVNENSPFFYICGQDEDGHYEFLGDLTLLNDGTAIVNNDYDGIGNRYFDSHFEAVRYVETRICDKPHYYDPVKQMFARITIPTFA